MLCCHTLSQPSLPTFASPHYVTCPHHHCTTRSDNNHALAVRPSKGSALVYYNQYPDGKSNPHAFVGSGLDRIGLARVYIMPTVRECSAYLLDTISTVISLCRHPRDVGATIPQRTDEQTSRACKCRKHLMNLAHQLHPSTVTHRWYSVCKTFGQAAHTLRKFKDVSMLQ